MQFVAVVLLVSTFAMGRVAYAQAGTSRDSLQRRLEQTIRQRAYNQKLLWDAADSFALKCLDMATSQGEVSSSENFTRIAEIARELNAEAKQPDGSINPSPVAELGRLLFLEIVTRVNEAAGAVSDIWNAVSSIPTLPAMFVDYVNFANASHEDARLRDVEISLQRQLDSSVSNTPPDSGPDTQTKPAVSPQPPQAQPRDLSELDDALVLLRFAETKDWSVEDKERVAKIAEKYPQIDKQYREALARERSTPKKTQSNTGQDPCSVFLRNVQLAQNAAEECGRSFATCIQPCGNPRLSTAAMGTCVKACQCDDKMSKKDKALKDWQDCKNQQTP